MSIKSDVSSSSPYVPGFFLNKSSSSVSLSSSLSWLPSDDDEFGLLLASGCSSSVSCTVISLFGVRFTLAGLLFGLGREWLGKRVRFGLGIHISGHDTYISGNACFRRIASCALSTYGLRSAGFVLCHKFNNFFRTSLPEGDLDIS